MSYKNVLTAYVLFNLRILWLQREKKKVNGKRILMKKIQELKSKPKPG